MLTNIQFLFSKHHKASYLETIGFCHTIICRHQLFYGPHNFSFFNLVFSQVSEWLKPFTFTTLSVTRTIEM